MKSVGGNFAVTSGDEKIASGREAECQSLSEEPGYISLLPWKHLYQSDLNPNHIRLALALASVAPPELKTFCELAYGQGLSLVLHAACNQHITWLGTDSNTDHYNFAMRIAGSGLTNLRLYNQPLSEFCTRPDVETVDGVGIMGTWSWLSASDQSTVCSFLSDRLTSRGIFCFNHATLPGQNSMTGLRHLLVSFAAGRGQIPGTLHKRTRDPISQAIEFSEINPAFMALHPSMRSILDEIKKMDAASLVHEYSDCNWRPAYFLDTAEFMKTAGLDWAASCCPGDYLEDLHLTQRQQHYLRRFNNAIFREHLRDFITYNSQRSDVWSKDLTKTDDVVRERLLRDIAFVLVRPKDDFTFKADGSLGEFALSRQLYAPLIDVMSGTQRITAGALHDRLGSRISFADLVEALTVLVHLQFAEVVAPSDDTIRQSMPTCRLVNRAIMDMVREGAPIRHLGSPVTGGGVAVPESHQLFLLAREQGALGTEAMAKFIASVLENRKDEGAFGFYGTSALPSSVNVLIGRAERFEHTNLPIYRALGMAD